LLVKFLLARRDLGRAEGGALAMQSGLSVLYVQSFPDYVKRGICGQASFAD
jgi:hypothetical protein